MPRFVMSFILISGIIGAANAQDPSLPDSITFGNLDGTPVLGAPGESISIPVWVKTDDSVTFALIYMAADSAFFSSFDGADFYWPLTAWDEVTSYEPDDLWAPPGFVNQGFVGFWCLELPCDTSAVLQTNYQWRHVAGFRLTIREDSGLEGDSTFILEGNDFFNEAPMFGMIGGTSGEIPVTVPGLLKVTEAAYYPGDSNGDCAVNGLDVIYLVNYLKGVGPPPERVVCD